MFAGVRQVICCAAPTWLRTIIPELTRRSLVAQLGVRRLLSSLPQTSATLASRRLQPLLSPLLRESPRRLYSVGEGSSGPFSSVPSSFAGFCLPPQAEAPRALPPPQRSWRERYESLRFIARIDALPESGAECGEMGKELGLQLRSLDIFAFKIPKRASKEQICSLLRGLGEESIRFEFMDSYYHEINHYRLRMDSSWWQPTAPIDLATLEGGVVLNRALAEGGALPHDVYHFGCQLSKLSDKQLDRFAELITSDNNAVYMRLLHPRRSWKSNVLFDIYTASIHTFPEKLSECYEMGQRLCDTIRTEGFRFISPCLERMNRPFSKEQLRSLLLGFGKESIILVCTEEAQERYEPRYVNLISPVDPKDEARFQQACLSKEALPRESCSFACQPSKLSEDQMDQLLEIVMVNPIYIRLFHRYRFSKEGMRSAILDFGEKLIMVKFWWMRPTVSAPQYVDLTKASGIPLLEEAYQNIKSLNINKKVFWFTCRPALLAKNQLDMLVEVVRCMPFVSIQDLSSQKST